MWHADQMEHGKALKASYALVGVPTQNYMHSLSVTDPDECQGNPCDAAVSDCFDNKAPLRGYTCRCQEFHFAKDGHVGVNGTGCGMSPHARHELTAYSQAWNHHGQWLLLPENWWRS